MRASLMESWMAAMTFGVLAIVSLRNRIAAVRVAATSSAPLRRSSGPVGSGMRRNCTLFAFCSSSARFVRCCPRLGQYPLFEFTAAKLLELFCRGCVLAEEEENQCEH